MFIIELSIVPHQHLNIVLISDCILAVCGYILTDESTCLELRNDMPKRKYNLSPAGRAVMVPASLLQILENGGTLGKMGKSALKTWSCK